MYEDFFKLKALPFSLTPNPNFFCELRGHQEALQTLKFSITSGEGFIKIIGEVGSGKTLLCRKLLEYLEKDYMAAYIPNPDLSPMELRKAFAREIGLDPSLAHDQHELVTEIHHRLIELHAAGKRVVLLVDEAQALSDESLETLRLFTNLETQSSKLLQVVLFGQPELDIRLNQSNLRQLKQRISFSYHLPLMDRKDLDQYLHHRLVVAGYTYADLFSKKARDILYQASQGIPRIVNILSHKALLVAFGAGESRVDHKTMRLAVTDTEAVLKKPFSHLYALTAGILSTILVLMLIFFIVGTMS